NHSCLPKEEAILRRASRFISSTCLWSALLCHINVGESAEVGRAKAADQNAAATAAPKSARQLYSAGRELYWQEPYSDAVAAFESAIAAPGDLSPADRNRLEDYLKRARGKAGAAAANEVVARGQSADQPPSVEASKVSSHQKHEMAKALLA